MTLLRAPVFVAHRLRVRERSVLIEDILLSDSPGDSPRRAFLLDCEGRAFSEDPPFRIEAWTTFYAVAEFAAGDRIPLGDDFAQLHPAFQELGTWFGSAGAPATDWSPSAGPLCYALNLRFRPGRARPDDLRVVCILELAAKGQTDRQIAAQLGLSEHTVESHWRALRERTGAASRTAAVAAYLAARHRREREDLEAQRDRTAVEAWLARRDASRGAVVRSWPVS